MKDNVIVEKSYEFALKVISICKGLNERSERNLSAQLFRSGTNGTVLSGFSVEKVGRKPARVVG